MFRIILLAIIVLVLMLGWNYYKEQQFRGILGHDTDGCSPSNERTLPEYTVTTVEPGIYIPGKFGVRIEDSIILVGDGHENMTKSPKELIIL